MRHHQIRRSRLRSRSKRSVTLLLIAITAFVAGCGGDDDKQSEGAVDEVPFGTTTAAADSGTTDSETTDGETTDDETTDSGTADSETTDGETTDDEAADDETADDETAGEDGDESSDTAEDDTEDSSQPREEIRADDQVLKDLISRGLYNHDQILPRCTPFKQRLGPVPERGAWTAEASPGQGFDVYYLCAQIPESTSSVSGSRVTLLDPSGAQVSQITLEAVSLLEIYGAEDSSGLPGNVSMEWDVLLGTTTATTGPRYTDHVGVTTTNGTGRLIQVLAFLPIDDTAVVGTWEYIIELAGADGEPGTTTHRADLAVHDYCGQAAPGSTYQGPDPLLPISSAPGATPFNTRGALAPDRFYPAEISQQLVTFEDNCRVLPQLSSDFKKFPVDEGETLRNGLTVTTIGGRCADSDDEIGEWFDGSLLHTGIDEGNFDVLATNEFYFFGSTLFDLRITGCPIVPDDLLGRPFTEVAAVLNSLAGGLDDDTLWTWYGAGQAPPLPEFSPNPPNEPLTVPEASHCTDASTVQLIQMVTYQPAATGLITAEAQDWPAQTNTATPVVRVVC